MDETPHVPPAEGERVERHEVIERTPADGSAAERRSAPMWAWLLPLVIVVIVLAWYVLSTGEPTSPLEGVPDIEIETPDVSGPEPPSQ